MSSHPSNLALNLSDICFQGGGTLGIAHIGALSRLEAAGALDTIGRVCGASAGAIVALGVAMRISARDLANEFKRQDFAEFEDGSYFRVGNWTRWATHGGLYKGEVLAAWIRRLVAAYAETKDADLTFEQLFASTRRELVVAVTNLTTGRVVYFDRFTSPHYAVATATAASACIPMFFVPKTYDGPRIPFPGSAPSRPSSKGVEIAYMVQPGDILVDGGVWNTLPVTYFFHRHVVPPKGTVLAVDFMRDDETPGARRRVKASSPWQLGNGLLDGSFTARDAELRSVWVAQDVSFLNIPVGDFDSFNFRLTRNDKSQLFELGRVAADEWLGVRSSIFGQNSLRIHAAPPLAAPTPTPTAPPWPPIDATEVGPEQGASSVVGSYLPPSQRKAKPTRAHIQPPSAAAPNSGSTPASKGERLGTISEDGKPPDHRPKQPYLSIVRKTY